MKKIKLCESNKVLYTQFYPHKYQCKRCGKFWDKTGKVPKCVKKRVKS